MKKIITIGGGNGQPVVLRALRSMQGLDIKAIVTTMDSGGSTGRLCGELDILPIGDIMKCILALSPQEEMLADFFTSRFALEGKLKGHTPGNMLFASMIKYSGDCKIAIDNFSERVGAVGEVIPVTYEKTTLVALYKNREIVKGEHNIDEPDEKLKNTSIKKIYIEPLVKANNKAIQAILDADYIFLGPGDLYTSLLANFTFDEIVNTIQETKAQIYCFMNLMSKKGQTDKMDALEIVSEIEKYLKRKLDGVIINNEKIPIEFIDYYKEHNEKEILDNLAHKKNVVRFGLIDSKPIIKDKNDLLYRSILKHDSNKVRKIIERIITK